MVLLSLILLLLPVTFFLVRNDIFYDDNFCIKYFVFKKKTFQVSYACCSAKDRLGARNTYRRIEEGEEERREQVFKKIILKLLYLIEIV